jgi:hypothetical protein
MHVTDDQDFETAGGRHCSRVPEPARAVQLAMEAAGGAGTSAVPKNDCSIRLDWDAG